MNKDSVDREGTLAYQIVRSRRKTMAIQIKKDGFVVLRVPEWVSGDEAERFAEEHREWIEKNRQRMWEKEQKRQSFRWEDGSRLLFMGGHIRLAVSVTPGTSRAEAWLDGVVLKVTIPVQGEEDVEAIAKAWYRGMAKRIIVQRTGFFAGFMGVDYGRISIREQRTRWGSCSAKGNLNFNWKLVCMPPEVLDYIVVHELAHRREMNHSPRFWAVVGEVLPDYMDRRRRLRDYENKVNT